jgi:hypothetical protein
MPTSAVPKPLVVSGRSHDLSLAAVQAQPAADAAS